MATTAIRAGRGVLRPFQRDRKNDFANGGGAALVASRIGQILGTRASSAGAPGEVAWRPAFGSRLHLLRHANSSAAREALARSYVVEALARWEPRVVVRAAEIVQVDRMTTIRIRYDVLGATGAIEDRDQGVTIPMTE